MPRTPLLLTAALALALGAAATAAEMPADILVTTSNAVVASNVPGYTLQFHRSGAAEFDGMLNGRDGHYQATIAGTAVEAALGESNLCERGGIPLFVQSRLTSGSMATQHVLVELRCAAGVKTFNDASATDIATLARTLLAVGTNLDWRYAGPARRGTLVRFAQ